MPRTTKLSPVEDERDGSIERGAIALKQSRFAFVDCPAHRPELPAALPSLAG